MPRAAASVDPADVARFEAMGRDWWDPKGPMRALHRMNPVRVGFIRDRLCAHFSQEAPRDPEKLGCLSGLRLLDIGCGAGLLCEPLARLGADVTGVDPGEATIAVAQAHAEAAGLSVAYRATTVEALAEEGARFDVVLAMEVVEHVADVEGFLAKAAGLVAPGGLFIGATLNRTFKSFALAIVGAEYVLGWLPKGTHRWEQFVTPEEFIAALRRAGLERPAVRGIVYDPLRGAFRESSDADVNYMIAAARPAA